MSAGENPSAAPAADGAGAPLAPAEDTSLPIGTVAEILKRAPADLKEETVPVPEWGCSVKIRSATAAQQAALKETFARIGAAVQSGGALGAMREYEVVQFQTQVIEPKFSEADVRRLQSTSGDGFQAVISAIDALGGGKEAERKALEEFQGPVE